MIKKSSNRAFTLIELLVVISIIGMLSSVILASLSSARDKAKVAKALTFEGHITRAWSGNIVAQYYFDDITSPPTDTSGFNNLALSCSNGTLSF